MTDHVLHLDKPRRLKFGFKAIRLLKEKFKDIALEDLWKLEIPQMIPVIKIGLAWEDEDITEEEVERLIDEQIPERYTVVKILEIVTAALIDHIGAEKGEKKKKKVNPRKPKYATITRKPKKLPSTSKSPTKNSTS